jgi:hypothetical protein
MGQYGNAAIFAIKSICNGMEPLKAWNMAISELTTSTESIKKGCPKSAFLGLCEEGFVKGVKRGNYSAGVNNKRYALKAVEIIHNNPNRTYIKNELWAQVLDELGLPSKTENGQMDVVLSLHNENLLVGPLQRG